MVVEVRDFETEVIRASHEKPVLVDFWAPWCGPCRQLGPVLERLAEEKARDFTLAKVNTDEAPAVAARYGVRSIPAVKLFVDGAVRDEFVGALPEAQVRRWLDAALPSEARRLLAEARSAAASGETTAARPLVEQALALEPENGEARVLLASLIVFSEPERAAEMAREGGRKAPAAYPLSQAVQTVADLLRAPGRFASLPDDPAKAPLLAAVERLGGNDLDGALAKLVESVRLNRRYEDEIARRACLALFEVLGSQHPLTRRHQRALEMALF